jgi:lipopolysaccharide/colanic/teichoic acid biosynthesis glycosyltransferase
MEGMFIDKYQLKNVPAFQHEFTHSQYAYFPVKRAIDIVLSLAGLVVLAPVFVLIAVAVKLDSKGPAIYRQKRLAGRGGKPIFMIKFRSMVADADNLRENIPAINKKDGPLYIKDPDDPRVTRVGRFLRKHSLDELPQLFNVLIGQMSLVGPRPLLFSEINQCMSADQVVRLSVPPGLTCIWQVSGRSNITSFEQRIGMDLDYVNKIGFLTDTALLLKTIPAVLFGRGAC